MDLSRKAVIIQRPTRLAQLIVRFNTKSQAKFYIEHLGGNFADYETEDDTYRRSLDTVCQGAGMNCRVHLIDWKQTTNYLFGPDDIVLTVGQDGLVVNTLKYLKRQPILGFNSDPGRWDGSLAQFSPQEAQAMVESTLEGKAQVKEITRALVKLSDRQQLLAVNDFFLGVSDHGSARYIIHKGKQQEQQSSSGVIISTPLGRSGWLKSVITGAQGLVKGLGAKDLKIAAKGEGSWADESLHFAVREPFPSVNTGTSLVFGKITGTQGLSIESKMGERGIIFSDGIQSDALQFNYNITATFGVAPEKGVVVVKRSPHG